MQRSVGVADVRCEDETENHQVPAGQQEADLKMCAMAIKTKKPLGPLRPIPECGMKALCQPLYS